MLRFVVRRLLLLVPILLGLSVLLFFWVRALPGSPAESLLGERATPALVRAYRERYGLDKPIWRQYLTYVQTTAARVMRVTTASGIEPSAIPGRIRCLITSQSTCPSPVTIASRT